MEMHQVAIQLEPLIAAGQSSSHVAPNQPSININERTGNAQYMHPIGEGEVRYRASPNHLALDITLDPNLATTMDWNIYFSLSKREQTIMLTRVLTMKFMQ